MKPHRHSWGFPSRFPFKTERECIDCGVVKVSGTRAGGAVRSASDGVLARVGFDRGGDAGLRSGGDCSVNPDDLHKLRILIAAGRIPDGDTSLKYEFRRGWNEGVEFAQNQVNKIFGKEETGA